VQAPSTMLNNTSKLTKVIDFLISTAPFCSI
jgi:hypothetical protein